MLLCKFTTRAASNQSVRASRLSVPIGRWIRLLASSFWFPVGASRCPAQRAERDVTPGVTSTAEHSSEFGEREAKGKKRREERQQPVIVWPRTKRRVSPGSTGPSLKQQQSATAVCIIYEVGALECRSSECTETLTDNCKHGAEKPTQSPRCLPQAAPSNSSVNNGQVELFCIQIWL
ncbi:hypothetical protein PHYPO_G00233420 [Pangasianodon hypophthalmus]|uniref:Uncharacterized protein n=1 Tax=Pangasianodon hypophthalmus TaxID=310915 RepID=A0A5N5NJ67_PANHP|nr:hypothetical protein PHYPO_G00233420 [Pangasianodon hypophthalmus]